MKRNIVCFIFIVAALICSAQATHTFFYMGLSPILFTSDNGVTSTFGQINIGNIGLINTGPLCVGYDLGGMVTNYLYQSFNIYFSPGIFFSVMNGSYYGFTLPAIEYYHSGSSGEFIFITDNLGFDFLEMIRLEKIWLGIKAAMRLSNGAFGGSLSWFIAIGG